jgi:DNA-binding MarR family transcriptional regulator
MHKSQIISAATKRPSATLALTPESTSLHSLAYLRFLSRIESSFSNHPASKFLPLDPHEKALLEMVVLRWAQQDTMTVRQTIGHAHLGSPATLHKRLTQLRQKGYLGLKEVEGDKRAKFLIPGPQGIQYLETMGKHMVNAKRKSLTADKSGDQ